jgi:prevent-host-death family protein
VIVGNTGVWTLAEARAKLGEVIERAQSDGPQTITVKERKVAVVIASGEWERKRKRSGNLAEFFADSPLRKSRLKAGRIASRRRAIDL